MDQDVDFLTVGEKDWPSFEAKYIRTDMFASFGEGAAMLEVVKQRLAKVKEVIDAMKAAKA
jgi:hypothetical protein